MPVIRIICLSAIIFFISACAEKINVFNLPETDIEKRENSAYIPASVNITDAKQVLLLVVKPDETDPQKLILFKDTVQFYKKNVEERSNLKINTENNINNRYPSVAEFLKYTRESDMDFAAVYSSKLLEYEAPEGKVYYKMGITVDYYQANSNRLIATNSLKFASNQKEDGAEEIKKFVINYFPIRGFVTETRGERQVAKLNVGSLAGLIAGDDILFRSTNLLQQNAAKNNVLFMTETIEYSDEIIGYGEIIHLNDESSWVLIENEYRKNIKPGVVGFLYQK